MRWYDWLKSNVVDMIGLTDHTSLILSVPRDRKCPILI